MKRAQREHGCDGGRREWARVNRINDDLSEKIAAAIVEYVKDNVFGHLDMQGKRTGGHNKLWRKNGIREIVTGKAHNAWIRISRICAWGTSRLAFDGSGTVTRNISVSGQKPTCSPCRFPDVRDKDGNILKPGKVCNCDLSASCNIGARCFLREWCNLKRDHIVTYKRACRSFGPDPKVTGERLDHLPRVPQRTWSHCYGLFHEA